MCQMIDERLCCDTDFDHVPASGRRATKRRVVWDPPGTTWPRAAGRPRGAVSCPVIPSCSSDGGGMPALELPGATLNYRTAGDGPPLVLVHGSATDLTTWDGVIDELARDHRVIAYDRRGYGQSRHRPSATTASTPAT